MSTSMNTYGNVRVPIDQLDALLHALDDLRQRPAIRSDRANDMPVTNADEAARLFSDLAGHVTLLGYGEGAQIGHGDVWSTVEPDGWYLEVCVPDGKAVDGWDDAVTVLAKHGAEGVFTRQSEYDDEPTRRRISAGKATVDEAFRVFTGDVIAWIGQMQSIDDTTLDHVVTAPTKSAALAALAEAARAEHTTHAGEVPADALPAEADTEAIVTAWPTAAGVKWTVRPIGVTAEMYPQPPTPRRHPRATATQPEQNKFCSGCACFQTHTGCPALRSQRAPRSKHSVTARGTLQPNRT